MKLSEIASIRLKELGVGAIEAATEAGLERAFIRDLVEGRKKSVRTDKLPDLARALKLDAAALARGEAVPTGDSILDMSALSPEEIELIRNFRASHDAGKRAIFASAKHLAEPLDDKGEKDQ